MSAITWAVVLLAGLTCTSASGIQTTLEAYPSLVQIEDRVGVTWLQQCIGSILTNYHVLSAASCFVDLNLETRRCRVGAAIRGVGGEVRQLSKITQHPTYGMLDQDGDIAVIQLQLALVFSPTVSQAALVGDGIYLPEGLSLQTAGWGTTAEGGLVGNDNLYSLEVVTVNEDSCLEKYLTAPTTKIITENMICVRARDTFGRNLDSRDCGAPLIYSGTTMGVISFGVSRGDDEFPIVATAVTSYSSWIIGVASQV